MSKRLYVGNLPFNTTEDEIKALFGQHGSVESVNFIRDLDSGRMRGFGFVEVATDDAAVMIADAELDGARLVAEVDSLLADPGRLDAMGKAMHAFSRPNAAADIAAIAEAHARN